MKENGQMGLDKVQITGGAVSGGSHRERTVEDTRGKKVGREKRESVFLVCVCWEYRHAETSGVS